MEIAFSCSPDYKLWGDFFFFCMSKHPWNNEQTNNVLREKKNILFLFAVSWENHLHLETHVGCSEYESWRLPFVVGMGLGHWKQSALARKRSTRDVWERQVSGLLGIEFTAPFRRQSSISCFMWMPSPPFPFVLLLPLFQEVRITSLFSMMLD